MTVCVTNSQSYMVTTEVLRTAKVKITVSTVSGLGLKKANNTGIKVIFAIIVQYR